MEKKNEKAAAEGINNPLFDILHVPNHNFLETIKNRCSVINIFPSVKINQRIITCQKSIVVLNPRYNFLL